MNWEFAPLPDIGVPSGIREGRSPREGYQRGWGLQFGGMRETVEAEALYRHAYTSIGLPTWVAPEKRANIYLIATRFLPGLASQDIIEFGTYKGGNALFMALVMRELAPKATIYALDTFAGMPTTDKALDAHNAGDFGDSSLDDLNRRIDELTLTNLVPVKWLFQDTFTTLPSDTTFGLAHIDADIYSAVKYAQDVVWPRMTPGGYIVYDDADVSSCIGATQAVEELIMDKRVHCEQIWPHFVYRAGL
jgi:predicted O-methyltransferase YrrM